MSNIERQSSFTHGRAGSQNKEIGTLQTGQNIIQVFVAGRYTADFTLVFVQFIQPIKAFAQDCLQTGNVLLDMTLADVKQLAFSFLDELLEITAFIVSDTGNLLRSFNQPPSQSLLGHNLGILLHMGGGRHVIGQFGEIGGPAHKIQKASTLQLVGKGKNINGAMFFIQLGYSFINTLVFGVIKIFKGDSVSYFYNRITIN